MDLPVEVLSALPLGVPRNWRAGSTAAFDEVVVSNGWPTALRGTLDMDGLIAPPPRNTSIGSYARRDAGSRSRPARPPASSTARISRQGRTVLVRRPLTLGADRSFLLEGTRRAARHDAAAAAALALQMLGPADADGRRQSA